MVTVLCLFGAVFATWRAYRRSMMSAIPTKSLRPGGRAPFAGAGELGAGAGAGDDGSWFDAGRGASA